MLYCCISRIDVGIIVLMVILLYTTECGRWQCRVLRESVQPGSQRRGGLHAGLQGGLAQQYRAVAPRDHQVPAAVAAVILQQARGAPSAG